MPDTVLLMDNKEKALQKWSSLLEADGYRVRRAASLEQAEEILRQEWIHLAILDIRMLDEDDENDISGLQLAQKSEFRSIPKIILTAYPSFEYVRAVLAPGVDGQTSAVNFVAKAEEPQTLREAVKQAFASQVRLNWDLEIQWDPQKGLSFLCLAGLLQPSPPSEALLHRAGELEGLFRRLFYEYQQIRIGQVLWHDGGRFCLPVLARSPQGVIHSRLLVAGEPEALWIERAQFTELAPSGEQDAKLVDSAETIRFGALLYDLAGSDANAVQPLKYLILGGGRGPVKAALLSLLQTVRSWHEQGQRTEDTDNLRVLYRQRTGLAQDGLPRSEVEQRVAALVQAVRPMTATEIEWNGEGLAFHFPSQPSLACPDPVAAVYQHAEWQSGPVVCKVSPGLLRFENVLVDPRQRAWLSDFSQAGQVPQWWDFVCLEAGIRFDLCEAPDMLALQDLEEFLVAPAHLHGRLRPQDVQGRDLQGIATLIQEVRRQAGGETGTDVLPYYAGLLTWVVGALAQYDTGCLYTQAELMRGAHLLLAAGMIARRMAELVEARNQGASSAPAGTENQGTGLLTLEEDGVTVRIGPEHREHLAGQELKLFRCLYEQAGQVVPRRVLVETVFEEAYDSSDKYQQRRLNSLVKRLREKLESGSGTPRYIYTVRGQGYRLERA